MKTLISAAILSLFSLQALAADCGCGAPKIKYACVCEGDNTSQRLNYIEINLEQGTTKVIRQLDSWGGSFDAPEDCKKAKSESPLCQAL